MSGYRAVHTNLTLVRGKASSHTCECGQPAAEWAYDHTRPTEDERIERGLKFSVDLMAYRPMCRRCHRLFDKAELTHCPQKHPYDERNTYVQPDKPWRRCRECRRIREAARRAKKRLVLTDALFGGAA